MNNSQALKGLKQASEQQNEELQNTIAEIHQKSLESLNKDLQNIILKSLNSSLDSMSQKLDSIKIARWRELAIAITASLIIGLIVGSLLLAPAYLEKTRDTIIDQNLKLREWQVPENQRAKDERGKYIKSQEWIWSQDKKTIYAKIVEN